MKWKFVYIQERSRSAFVTFQKSNVGKADGKLEIFPTFLNDSEDWDNEHILSGEIDLTIE